LQRWRCGRLHRFAKGEENIFVFETQKATGSVILFHNRTLNYNAIVVKIYSASNAMARF
jgi:hypothetical protein